MTPTDFIGPLGVIVGAILGILGYRRAKKVDKVVENSAIVEAQTGAMGQVITGLNLIIDSLREDNIGWRELVKEMRVTVNEMALRLEKVVADRDEIRKQLNDCLEKARKIGT